jgi:hypothetical protein
MPNHSRPDDRSLHQSTGCRRAAARLLLTIVALGTAAGAAAQTPVTAGFRDFSYGTNGNSTPTGEKPESKLWWNDGYWWGSLFNTQAAEYHIYRFNQSTQSWTDTGTVLDTRTNTKADVLWDEQSNHLYVVSHMFTTDPKPSTSSSKWGKLFRYTYDSANKRYTPDAGFPVNVTRGTVEALTIAKDSTQRLWVTWVESGVVKINWSVTGDTDWGLPVTMPVDATAADVDRDDISAVIAFGTNKIGVIWSNQVTRKDYFAVHRDSDAPNVWQPLETVVPNPGCSGACADDHFSLKTDSQGKVYAAIKTSLTSSSQPLVMLAVRATNGAWSLTTFGREGDHHTRPIVLLDEGNNRLFMFATSGESGGTIYGKTAPLDAISFPSGKGDAYIKSSSDTSINNASSTKQNLSPTTGLLIVASGQDTDFYFHNFVPLTGGAVLPPTAPNTLSASAVSSTRVDLTWNDASDNEDEFRIERATNGGAFGEIAIVGPNSETYSDTAGLTGGNTYSYRVRANNSAGFSGYSNTSSATTPAPPAPPADPTGLDATAVAFNRVDVTWTDAANNETAYHLERATGGGSFAEIASLPANAASFSDTTAAASTTYQYRVRAENGGVFSGYSNADSATTPAAPANQPIKHLTFESGALVDPATGADKVSGSVSLESASPLKGAFSANVTAGSSYLEQNFGTADDLYVSLYVRLAALPSGDVRLAQITSAGTTIGSLVVRTTGRLRLSAVGVTVSADSAPLVVGQLYRIGIHQKRGTGGDAVLEAFVASVDAGFGAAFATTTTGAWTTGADRIRIGATTTTAVNATVDDIKLDAAAMPGPSVP